MATELGIYNAIALEERLSELETPDQTLPPAENSRRLLANTDLEDTLIRNQDRLQEVDQAETNLELADQGFRSLESFMDTLNVLNNRGGINSQTAFMLNHYYDNVMRTNFGINLPKSAYYSIESFGTSESKKVATAIALEDIAAKAKQIVDQAYQFILDLIEKIKKACRTFFDAADKMKKRAQEVKTSLAGREKEKTKYTKISNGLANKFYLCDPKSFKTKIVSVGDALEKLEKIMKSLISGNNPIAKFADTAQATLNMLEKARDSKRAQKKLTRNSKASLDNNANYNDISIGVFRFKFWTTFRWTWKTSDGFNKANEAERQKFERFFPKEIQNQSGVKKYGELSFLKEPIPGGYLLACREYRGDLLEGAAVNQEVNTGEMFPTVKFSFQKGAEITPNLLMKPGHFPSNGKEIIALCDQVIAIMNDQSRAQQAMDDVLDDIKKKLNSIKKEMNDSGVFGEGDESVKNKVFSAYRGMISSLGTPISQMFRVSVSVCKTAIDFSLSGLGEKFTIEDQ